MATTVDAMAGILVAELRRLSNLDASDGEKIATECMRSKAINDTVKTACTLGELHLHSQMMRMGKDTDSFQPGALFADRQEHAWSKPKARKLEAGEVVSDGGKTVINEHGEFETDDGLDAYTARVPKGWEKEQE